MTKPTVIEKDMKRKTSKRQKELDKTAELIKFLVDKYSELDHKIWKRCALEGCRYGYEVFDKEIANECMYCGEPRNHYFDVDYKPIESIQKSLKKHRPKLL